LPGLPSMNIVTLQLLLSYYSSYHMKICIVGSGYVGLSLAVLLSQKYEVITLDICEERVKLINKKKSPIDDKELSSYLSNKPLNLNATLNKKDAYSKADYVILATPTNYDIKTGAFDTTSVEGAISDCTQINSKATIVIKSTIPLGFTHQMRKKFSNQNILFSPEFLRESKSLYDNLYPSRIVVGDFSKEAKKFAQLLINCSKKNKAQVPLLEMDSSEAEAVKLFSNTFLAMRVSFFNELDSFAESQNLSSEKIIKGVSSDHRIGDYYNNPSFGYGGYCLPKDTKQLLSNFSKVPNNLIKAVVASNKTRKKFIIGSIKNSCPGTVGVYRLIMKKGSDNFRESAVLDIIKGLKKEKIKVVIFEPYIKKQTFAGLPVINNRDEFIESSDLIIANRFSEELKHVIHKVYSRDLFYNN